MWRRGLDENEESGSLPNAMIEWIQYVLHEWIFTTVPVPNARGINQTKPENALLMILRYAPSSQESTYTGSKRLLPVSR
jgi:hypothetical protein